MLSTKEKIKSILTGLVGGILVAFWIHLMVKAINIPDVLVSHSTGECVGVFNYDEDDRYTCQNLPDRYNHIWVK